MGMTLGEFSTRMSSAEIELRYALALLRQDECPNCGVEPIDMMEYETTTQHCPVCSHDYEKVKRL